MKPIITGIAGLIACLIMGIIWVLAIVSGNRRKKEEESDDL